MSDFDDLENGEEEKSEDREKIANYPFGKFLTHVGPEDLDDEGRFICDEPVLIIGSEAFKDVRDKLTYVKIKGVLSIENEAFAGCVHLKKADIEFELNHEYLELYDCVMFWKRQFVNSVEDFERCLDEYVKKYGKNDVHIKDGAFENCISLESFHFPDRIVLHESPFRNCNSMSEVTFDGVLYLDVSADTMNKLGEYDLPFRAVTFRDCENIQKINFFDGNMVFIDELASFENLREINFPGSIYQIRAFWREAIRLYPHMLLALPTSLYRNSSFTKACLKDAYGTLKQFYGQKDCEKVYLNLVKRKSDIEFQKKKKETEIRRKTGRTASRIF